MLKASRFRVGESLFRIGIRSSLVGYACLSSLLALDTLPAAAEIPEAAALLTELGLSKAEIDQIEAGTIVRHDVTPASDRELTVGLAFKLPQSPTELVGRMKSDLLDQVDPTVSEFGVIAGASASASASAGSLDDFSRLTFKDDADKRAKGFLQAKPGADLNLSAEEIALFQKLGKSAAPSAVEKQLRSLLLARLQSYQTKGLDGIAPYARESGGVRSPADEIRTMIQAAKTLEKYAPAAYQYLLSYPKGKPEGVEESFRWSQFDAHGTPTVALTQMLLIPDGDAWLVSQRQFYVGASYNAEQALAVWLPSKGGTVMVYANRTSTDQVTGFGGGAKRSIGSKLLASQLESLFSAVRKGAK